jgi:hypothetical protein
MNDELQFLWYHMRGDFGWLMAAISWITALRLAFKPINGFFQNYISNRPATQTAWAQRLLSSTAYGFVVFTLDYLASIKLPTANKTGNTEFIQKPTEPGK